MARFFLSARLAFLSLSIVLCAFSSLANEKPKSLPKVESKPVLTKWTIDPDHSAANFEARHLGVAKVRGSFHGIKGEVVTDEKDVIQTSVMATIDIGTIYTGVEKRDNHLKSGDFFAADQHPQMKFVSKKVVKNKDGTLKMSGDLTIRGITKPVTLDVRGPTPPIKNPAGNYSTGLSASTTINRKDFGLHWNKVIEGIAVVGDDIKVEIDVELIRPVS